MDCHPPRPNPVLVEDEHLTDLKDNEFTVTSILFTGVPYYLS